MRIGIYDPYLDTLGGGEKYMLEAAVYYSRQHEVSFFWQIKDKENLHEEVKKRFQLDLSPVNFVGNPFSAHSSLLEKRKITKDYDVILYLSDGSIPFLFAHKNILMFQHPVNWVKLSALSRIKLRKIARIICNSSFTKQYIDPIFETNALVINPPVHSVKIEGRKKEKMILSVGRFTRSMNAKKQDTLIEAFKQFCIFKKGWRLVLIGGMLEEDNIFVSHLRKLAEGYPIEIKTNTPHTELMEAYNAATFYWHATGYNEDVERHPEKTEHFGISIVEAMSAGSIPIVFDAGGQTEIITDGQDGFVWDTPEELVNKTLSVLDDKNLPGYLSKHAEKRAKDFDETVFYRKLDQLLS